MEVFFCLPLTRRNIVKNLRTYILQFRNNFFNILGVEAFYQPPRIFSFSNEKTATLFKLRFG